MPTQKTEREKLNFLSLLIISLSVYVLIALLVGALFHLPKEVSDVLHIIDNIICFVFLYDFGFRFYKAENKLKFMKWGWIDLLSSIPALDYLRPGRTLQLIRLLRIVRAFRSTKYLIQYLFKKYYIQQLFKIQIFRVR